MQVFIWQEKSDKCWYSKWLSMTSFHGIPRLVSLCKMQTQSASLSPSVLFLVRMLRIPPGLMHQILSPLLSYKHMLVLKMEVLEIFVRFCEQRFTSKQMGTVHLPRIWTGVIRTHTRSLSCVQGMNACERENGRFQWWNWPSLQKLSYSCKISQYSTNISQKLIHKCLLLEISAW